MLALIWTLSLLMASPTLILNEIEPYEPMPGVVLYEMCVEPAHLHHYKVCMNLHHYKACMQPAHLHHYKVCMNLHHYKVCAIHPSRVNLPT